MNYPDRIPAVDSASNDVTLIEKIIDVGSTAKGEFRDTNLYGKSVLLALGLMTAYEWGPGNEALTPIIGGQALEASDGVKGIALTAGITGGFTLAQQLSSSWLTRRSAQRFPEVASKTYSYMNNDAAIEEKFKYKPYRNLPIVKKWLYPFTIGTSFVVAREAAVTGSINDEELKVVGRKSAALVAGSVAIIASSMDVLDQAIPDGTNAQGILNFFKTPIPYVAAVVGVLGKDYLSSRKHKKASLKEII